MHGVWVVAAATALAALLIAGLGRLLAELLEVSSPREVVVERTVSDLEALRIATDDDGLVAEFRGRPEATIQVTLPSGDSLEVTLDGEGVARVPLVTPLPAPAADQTGRVRPAPASTPPPEDVERAPPRRPSENTPPERRARVVVHPLEWPGRPSAPARIEATATPEVRPNAVRVEPRPGFLGSPPVLHHVGDAGPMIALTFDGGASSNRTVELLDLLQELDLRVTLFVTGQFIENQPSLIRRAVLAGHEVGNHTYSHPRLTTYARNRRQATRAGVDRAFLVSQLERAETAFRRATGRPMAPLWRGPYGEENAQLRAWALEAGYLHVRWSSLGGRSLDTLDWVDDEHSALYRDSEEIARRLLAFPRLEGGIALLHLSTRRIEAPWTHLPELVAALQGRGLEPVQVTELLEASPTWSPWLQRATERHHALYGADTVRAEGVGRQP